jgi:hypothetical protein
VPFEVTLCSRESRMTFSVDDYTDAETTSWSCPNAM